MEVSGHLHASAALPPVKDHDNYVKAQPLSWFGHTNRMPETFVVKRIYKWRPFTGRQAGKMMSGMV